MNEANSWIEAYDLIQNSTAPTTFMVFGYGGEPLRVQLDVDAAKRQLAYMEKLRFPLPHVIKRGEGTVSERVIVYPRGKAP